MLVVLAGECFRRFTQLFLGGQVDPAKLRLVSFVQQPTKHQLPSPPAQIYSNDLTRETEQAAMASLEAAERRRAEWEEKASGMAAKLREREAEVGGV